MFAASLTPSLLPRDPVMQGVLAGTVAAIAHEIAGGLQWLWAILGLPRLSDGARRLALRLGAGVGLVAVLWGLSQAKGWQDVTRAVLGLPPAEAAGTLVIAALGAGCFLVLWLLARAFGVALRRVARAAERVLPPRLALGAGVLLAAWAFWAVIDGALVRTGFRVADASFAAAEAAFDDDAPQPVMAGRSGGPGSVVAWEDLGRHGRRFVATAPTAAEIAAFTGAPAIDPVRVYVGRRRPTRPRGAPRWRWRT